MPEKGLLSFIKMKMESSVKKEDIKKMLIRAGFPEAHIDKAFDYVKKLHSDTHQDDAASNDFLPPLKKDGERYRTVSSPNSASKTSLKDAHSNKDEEPYPQQLQKGLFYGRLRRKDFVLGFLFFFGIGYVVMAFSSVFLSILAPHLWNTILDTIDTDTNNYLLMLVPVLLAPITVMMLSLISRRLHNLGLSGGLSFLFLVWFLPSFGQVFGLGFLALQIALLILFIVLVTVKGNPAINRFGPLPGSRGSFFKRIFNV